MFFQAMCRLCPWPSYHRSGYLEFFKCRNEYHVAKPDGCQFERIKEYYSRHYGITGICRIMSWPCKDCRPGRSRLPSRTWLAQGELSKMVHTILPQAEFLRKSTIETTGLELWPESSDSPPNSSTSYSTLPASEDSSPPGNSNGPPPPYSEIPNGTLPANEDSTPTESSIEPPPSYGEATMTSGVSRVDSRGSSVSFGSRMRSTDRTLWPLA